MKKYSLLNMLFALLIIHSILLASCNQNDDDSQIIEGKIKGLGNNSVVLVDDEGKMIDTVQAVNDYFVFNHQLNIKNPRFYRIKFPDLKFPLPAKRNADGFFVDSKKIEIIGSLKDTILYGYPGLYFHRDKIIGSKLTIAFNEIPGMKYPQLMSKLYDKLKRTEKEAWDNIDYEKLLELNKIQAKLDSIKIDRFRSVVNSIPNGESSIAMSYYIYMQTVSSNSKSLKEICGIFSRELDDAHYIKRMKERIQIKDKIAIGAVIPCLEVKDLDNNIIDLASVVGKGNYVLLDFWANW